MEIAVPVETRPDPEVDDQTIQHMVCGFRLVCDNPIICCLKHPKCGVQLGCIVKRSPHFRFDKCRLPSAYPGNPGLSIYIEVMPEERLQVAPLPWRFLTMLRHA